MAVILCIFLSIVQKWEYRLRFRLPLWFKRFLKIDKKAKFTCTICERISVLVFEFDVIRVPAEPGGKFVPKIRLEAKPVFYKKYLVSLTSPIFFRPSSNSVKHFLCKRIILDYATSIHWKINKRLCNWWQKVISTGYKLVH